MLLAAFVLSSLISNGIANPAGSSAGQTSPEQAPWPVVDTERLTASQQQIEIEKGRHLNLFCLGSGTPTVLFESGTGGASYDWRYVQASVAQTTTACAYDRAGFGFSDGSRRISDADDAADDLLKMVARAHLRLPPHPGRSLQRRHLCGSLCAVARERSSGHGAG